MRRLLALARPHAKLVPLEELFSEPSQRRIALDLSQAGIDFPPAKFLPLCLLLSLALAFYFSVIAALVLSLDLPAFLSLLLFSFALLFHLLSSFPGREKGRLAEQLETDLPMLLRSLAIMLEIRMPFERALKAIASSGFAASSHFAQAHNEIRGGASVQQALTSLAERIDSPTIKRSMNQLIIAYEHGGKADALKRIADELIATQRARLSEFSAKMAFLTLLFIAASALVPAFFSVFALVGASFLSLRLSAPAIWLAYLAAFPLIDALLLALILSKSPPTPSSPRRSITRELALIDGLLSSRNFPLTARQTLLLAALAGFLSAAALALSSYFLPPLLPLALLALCLPVLSYFYLSYLIEQRAGEIEGRLPDALFHAASLHKGMSMEKMISSITKSDYGALSEEFAIAGRQIRAGASVHAALSSMAERGGSALLERANSLLLQGYASGADMYDALRETAEDMLSLSALVRERAASLSLQRYTLLAGVAVLVPLILGTALNITSSLPPLPASFMQAPQDPEAIRSASSSAPPFYLLACSLLSSVLIAQQEGNPKKFLLYFLFLAPTSLALFTISLSTNLFSLLA